MKDPDLILRFEILDELGPLADLVKQEDYREAIDLLTNIRNKVIARQLEREWEDG